MLKIAVLANNREDYAEFIENKPEDEFAVICHTMDIGDKHFRGVVVLEDFFGLYSVRNGKVARNIYERVLKRIDLV